MLPPYGHSLALVADLYELTMACGYWREGLADRPAVFHHYFRTLPFRGGFAIAAGLGNALEWLRSLRFPADDLAYLATLQGEGGRPLFEEEFLEYLRELTFRCDVDAVPEGTAVFPNEPLVRIRGPLLQCQLAESAVLNIVNFQTLVATKAARVCRAAGDDPVLEFGLRRAPGIDGGLGASRAAYVGGCAATSNLLAGKTYGIPVRGTHAHSWVLSFDSETAAFEAYARAMPHNCVLLVDTYDTSSGIDRAIAAGRRLQERGHRLRGIRLDSGDLAALSVEARARLDAAGLSDTQIVASNDLDEFEIARLKRQGARIDIWGVGTSIAAAKGEAALGGVYKLALLGDGSGRWTARAKRSEDPSKASTPGMLQVRRYATRNGFAGDLLYDELHPPEGPWTGSDANLEDSVAFGGACEDLLRSALRNGRPVGPPEALSDARGRCRKQLSRLPAEVLAPEPAQAYPVLTEVGLLQRQSALFARTRSG